MLYSGTWNTFIFILLQLLPYGAYVWNHITEIFSSKIMCLGENTFVMWHPIKGVAIRGAEVAAEPGPCCLRGPKDLLPHMTPIL